MSSCKHEDELIPLGDGTEMCPLCEAVLEPDKKSTNNDLNISVSDDIDIGEELL